MTKYFLFILTLLIPQSDFSFKIPIRAVNRNSTSEIELTHIGKFGLLRKEREKVPAHFHTGIDIKRPYGNYGAESIFPIYEGIVISKREDGPYAQLIIEHDNGDKFWTVYEHVAGIKVNLYDQVLCNQPIARFMNKNELNKYGWQFDHFHFEVLKICPLKLKFDKSKPERRFASYSLVCYTQQDLSKYFYEPLEFLNQNL